MNQAIMDFASHEFYDGELEADLSVRSSAGRLAGRGRRLAQRLAAVVHRYGRRRIRGDR